MLVRIKSWEGRRPRPQGGILHMWRSLANSAARNGKSAACEDAGGRQGKSIS